MPCIAWVLLIKSVSGKRIARVENINHFAIKFQFIEQNKINTPTDLKNLSGLIICFLRSNYAFLDRRGRRSLQGEW